MEIAHRARLHLDGKSRRDGCQKAAVLDNTGIDEVRVQVIHERDPLAVFRPGDRHIVDHRKVMDVFAKPDTAGMRPDQKAEFRRHELHREPLVQSAEATRIDRHEVDGPIRDELLEQDPVLAHLAGSDLDRRETFSDGAMAHDVVGAGRFFEEQWAGKREGSHPVYRLFDLPDLGCVDHDVRLVAQRRAGDGQAPDVVFEVSSHFDYRMVEPGLAGLAGLAAQPAQLSSE